MAEKRTLSEAIESYLGYRRTNFAMNTVKNDESGLRRLLSFLGNIQCASIRPEHMDRYRAWRSPSVKASTLNMDLSTFMAFFKWARTRGFMPRDQDPMIGHRWLKVAPSSRLLIPKDEFPLLLDAAPHPRDRLVVAMGLYLFLRQGEIGALRVEDVDLDRAEVDVLVPKTSQRDQMPICSELDIELRRWLTWYSVNLEGPLLPSYYLAPSKTPAYFYYREGRRCHRRSLLRPEKQTSRLYDVTKRSLAPLGYETKWEGGHTLRRSGARALYDELAGRGHDRAIRQVQSMLHHKSITMTERYLGIDIDVKQRNDMLRGVPMFQATPDNVIQIKAATEG